MTREEKLPHWDLFKKSDYPQDVKDRILPMCHRFKDSDFRVCTSSGVFPAIVKAMDDGRRDILILVPASAFGSVHETFGYYFEGHIKRYQRPTNSYILAHIGPCCIRFFTQTDQYRDGLGICGISPDTIIVWI
jgi:hypothetical protein